MGAAEQRVLRNILGCYATGVAIITTQTEAGVNVGVTVNSFVSVSLDPPLILFSLAHTANILSCFQQSETSSINILGTHQQALSNMFAKPSSAKWAEVPFSCAANGCAMLSGSLAHLECKKTAELDGGDHVIFLCEVTAFHLNSPGEPLLFYRGAYGTYTRDQWSSMPPPDSSLSDFSVAGWG